MNSAWMHYWPGLVLLTLLAVILSPIASSSPQEGQPEAVFLTAHHGGIAFYSNVSKNTTELYDSSLTAFSGLSVHLVGLNLSYNLSSINGNYSVNGTTNSTYTVFHLPLNGSYVWPVLLVGNNTYNFGRIYLTKAPAQIFPDVITPTILLTEYLERERETLVGAGFAAFALMATFYLVATRIKRGLVTRGLNR